MDSDPKTTPDFDPYQAVSSVELEDQATRYERAADVCLMVSMGAEEALNHTRNPLKRPVLAIQFVWAGLRAAWMSGLAESTRTKAQIATEAKALIEESTQYLNDQPS